MVAVLLDSWVGQAAQEDLEDLEEHPAQQEQQEALVDQEGHEGLVSLVSLKVLLSCCPLHLVQGLLALIASARQGHRVGQEGQEEGQEANQVQQEEALEDQEGLEDLLARAAERLLHRTVPTGLHRDLGGPPAGRQQPVRLDGPVLVAAAPEHLHHADDHGPRYAKVVLQ